MSSLKIIPVLICLLSSATSCSYEEMLNMFVPEEESEFAKEYLANLRKENMDEVRKHLSSDLQTPETYPQLVEVARYFPEGEPIEVKIISSNVLTSPTLWQANLTYQYQFEEGWAVAEVVLAKENERLVVKGVHVNRLSQSLEETNAFALSGKSITHYLFLIGAVAIPLFIVFSLVLCVKTSMEKRKWLWVIFVLFGFVGLSLDWTTGQMSAQPISLYLLGVMAYTASPYSPWVITMSVPFGAMIFLWRRKSLIKRGVTNEDSQQP